MVQQRPAQQPSFLERYAAYLWGGVGVVVLAFILLIWPGWVTNAFGSSDNNGNDNSNNGDSKALATAYAMQTAAAQPTATPQPKATTPGATQVAQPTPQASGQPAAKCPGDHVVNPNETYNVPAGCNVKGDVVVNGQALYDDDPATGLLVSCPQGCTITAPFGANVSPRTIDDLKSEMLSTGCGSKCTDVKVVVIDSKAGANPAQVTDLCDISLPKGAKAMVPGGCVISGDIAVNGKALYDSDQTTGLVVVVKAEVEVFAPYGASVTNANVDDVVSAVKQTGCGLPNGCRIVNTVTVP